MVTFSQFKQIASKLTKLSFEKRFLSWHGLLLSAIGEMPKLRVGVGSTEFDSEFQAVTVKTSSIT